MPLTKHVGKRRATNTGRRKKESLNLQYSMLIQWSDEDQTYIVTLPEFGGCKTHGDTYEQAAKHGREVLELLNESSLEEGESLPAPAKHMASALLHSFGKPQTLWCQK